jgi:hypothetical protein
MRASAQPVGSSDSLVGVRFRGGGRPERWRAAAELVEGRAARRGGGCITSWWISVSGGAPN